MQLSQQALLWLFCASFIAGLWLALFSDVLYAMRLCLMPASGRYTVSVIQNLLAKYKRKESREVRKRIPLATFLSDVLLCIVGAITLILVLYWFNDGAFRIEAPLCMAIGFYLCRITASKGFRILLQWFLFTIETVFYMLLMPLRHLCAWVVRTHKKNVQRRRLKRFTKERKTLTDQLIKNIDRAAEMLLPIELKIKEKKGDNHATKSQKTV